MLTGNAIPVALLSAPVVLPTRPPCLKLPNWAVPKIDTDLKSALSCDPGTALGDEGPISLCSVLTGKVCTNGTIAEVKLTDESTDENMLAEATCADGHNATAKTKNRKTNYNLQTTTSSIRKRFPHSLFPRE